MSLKSRLPTVWSQETPGGWSCSNVPEGPANEKDALHWNIHLITSDGKDILRLTFHSWCLPRSLKACGALFNLCPWWWWASSSSVRMVLSVLLELVMVMSHQSWRRTKPIVVVWCAVMVWCVRDFIWGCCYRWRRGRRWRQTQVTRWQDNHTTRITPWRQSHMVLNIKRRHHSLWMTRIAAILVILIWITSNLIICHNSGGCFGVDGFASIDGSGIRRRWRRRWGTEKFRHTKRVWVHDCNTQKTHQQWGNKENIHHVTWQLARYNKWHSKLFRLSWKNYNTDLCNMHTLIRTNCWEGISMLLDCQKNPNLCDECEAWHPNATPATSSN